MTEQNTPSAPVEETTTAAERHQQPEPEIRREKKSGPILGAIAIALAIALGAGLYYHGHQQAQLQEAANIALQEQLAELKQSQLQEKQQLES
ncbi:uroporphyrinogen-III C-methyltransferase, partial [Yersinia enterocolitica]